MTSLQKTHLYGFHRLRAHMTTFGGFEMPLWYKGIIEEHMAVRSSVGIFDVTHLGRALVTGLEAEAFLNYVTTNNVASLEPLSGQYSTMCNEGGGVKDDLVLFKLESEKFFMVYNAANREKDYGWLVQQARPFNVRIEDVSDRVATFAVQGPEAEGTLQRVSKEDLREIKCFGGNWTKIAGTDIFISRIGYTGEDGFELNVWDIPVSNPERAIKVWNTILEAGRGVGIEPCGLGARDTLRLEAGLCLYGNDLDEDTTPLEAQLSFLVKFEKGDFIGKQALLKQKSEGIAKKRVGIRMVERGIPRPHYEVWKRGEKIGEVTSGTFSPLLKLGIAMAYVSADHATEGEAVEIKIRDKFVKGEIVKLPFYRRISQDQVLFTGQKVTCPVGDWKRLGF
ncbi:MAG: glycine cleavage system aminomethyltransferase GcvT [Candidatus Bathyarchaeia archaeon]